MRHCFRTGVTVVITLLLCCITMAQEACRYCKSDKLLHSYTYCDGRKSVCELCAKKLPNCSQCRLTGQNPPHRDGRIFCPSCKSAGVWTETQARQLQSEVVKFIQSLLGPTALNPCPPVQVVDRDELQTRFTAGGRALQVSGFYQANNPEMVYLESGTAPIELLSVMAHEYTHAWQSRNCTTQDRAVSEGFACWVQYKYLLQKGENARAMGLTQHQDPDYGASLVKILEKERQLGAKGVVEWAKKAKNFNK